MKYEYFSKRISPKESEEFVKELNAMGNLGWELIQINNGLAIFKRLISENEKKMLLEDTYLRE